MSGKSFETVMQSYLNGKSFETVVQSYLNAIAKKYYDWPITERLLRKVTYELREVLSFTYLGNVVTVTQTTEPEKGKLVFIFDVLCEPDVAEPSIPNDSPHWTLIQRATAKISVSTK